MADFSLHPLTSALGLALPKDAVVRAAPQAVAAEHPAQGWRLTAFQRPATAGASAAQLHAAVVGSLVKRHPDAVPGAAATPVTSAGWQGLSSELGMAAGRTLRVLTVLEAETALLAGVVLDVGSGVDLQPEHLLRSTVAPAPPKPILSLAPLDDAPAVTSKPALSLAPIEGDPAPPPKAVSAAPPTARASFTLAPVEAEPTAAETPAPAGARARFGAREPAAGPVAAHLSPVAAAGPPPLPAANPYQPPDTVALEADAEADPAALIAAGRGQRILIWCVLLSFAARGLYRNPEIPMLVNWTIAVALMAWAFHGVLLIAGGFGYGRGAKLGLLFGSTVPLLGIGLWIWLSMKTTRALRAAGYTVGFFGVKS